MLDYLQGKNSKLADEVAFLRDQLKLKSVGNAASGLNPHHGQLLAVRHLWGALELQRFLQ